MITVKQLSLRIRQTDILKNVDITFQKGKIHGLIGRNGSGKTMLMKCICGFVVPTTGEITVAGKKIGKDCDFIENAGVIIETPEFIPYYSGYKNLKLLADLNKKISGEQIRETMEKVGSRSETSCKEIFAWYAAEVRASAGDHGKSGYSYS